MNIRIKKVFGHIFAWLSFIIAGGVTVAVVGFVVLWGYILIRLAWAGIDWLQRN